MTAPIAIGPCGHEPYTPAQTPPPCRQYPGQKDTVEDIMKTLATLIIAAGMLCGCISSSSPPPPAKTTVVVPPNSTTTVVCQDGTKPPCE
jgi:hypothetical protein